MPHLFFLASSGPAPSRAMAPTAISVATPRKRHRRFASAISVHQVDHSVDPRLQRRVRLGFRPSSRADERHGEERKVHADLAFMLDLVRADRGGGRRGD